MTVRYEIFFDIVVVFELYLFGDIPTISLKLVKKGL